MQDPRLGDELLLALDVVGIRHAAVHGTDGGALLLIEEADALRALLRHDVVHVLRERRAAFAAAVPRSAALVDRRVGAFRLAGAAVDALLGDHGGHAGPDPTQGGAA